MAKLMPPVPRLRDRPTDVPPCLAGLVPGARCSSARDILGALRRHVGGSLHSLPLEPSKGVRVPGVGSRPRPPVGFARAINHFAGLGVQLGLGFPAIRSKDGAGTMGFGRRME